MCAEILSFLRDTRDGKMTRLTSGEVAGLLVKLVWEGWLREPLVRPARQEQRVGKRMTLPRQKPNCPERERHSVVGMTTQSWTQC